jgi:hypothetical protein
VDGWLPPRMEALNSRIRHGPKILGQGTLELEWVKSERVYLKSG